MGSGWLGNVCGQSSLPGGDRGWAARIGDSWWQRHGASKHVAGWEAASGPRGVEVLLSRGSQDGPCPGAERPSPPRAHLAQAWLNTPQGAQPCASISWGPPWPGHCRLSGVLPTDQADPGGIQGRCMRMAPGTYRSPMRASTLTGLRLKRMPSWGSWPTNGEPTDWG